MLRRDGTVRAVDVPIDVERDLTAAEYELFRRLVYEKSGISLGDQKQQLLRARLGKRLRAGNYRTYREYYDYVRNDASGAELCALIDAISTNTTHLFRERQHFDFLMHVVRDLLANHKWRATNRVLRVWSAGCSTGDEPYSIAMTLDDVIGSQCDWKVLATDISTKVLAKARAGVYDAHRLGTVPGAYRARYFVHTEACAREQVQVNPTLRKRITFSRFNLMADHFPFRHGFQFIFCRNVMIYFDRPTQEGLVARFSRHLLPGGHLLIGHSESLNSIKHGLTYVQPTVYQQVGS